MSEKSSDSRRPSSGEMAEQQLTFEQRVAHLAAGYNNSQSVVQFLDTKAGAVIAVVPIAVGLLAAAFDWLHDVWDWQMAVRQLGWWAPITAALVVLVCVIVVVACAWGALVAAFKALSPRNVGKSLPSVLFPYETADFEARLDLFMGKPAERDALEDYRRQLMRMSEIMKEKIGCTQRAVKHLRLLFVWSAVTLLALIAITFINAAIVGSAHSHRGATTQPDAITAQSSPRVED